MVADESSTANGEEVAQDLRLYLSRRLPPEKLTGFLPRLAAHPPELVAREIHEWARQETGPAHPSEVLSLGLRRFLALQTGGDAGRRHAPFVRAVADAVTAQASSPEERDRLAADAGVVARPGGIVVSPPGEPRPAPVESLLTPAGPLPWPAAPEPGSDEPLSPSAEPPPPPAEPPAPAASPRRLTLILDRLDASSAADPRRKPQVDLMREAVLTAALAASEASELETTLEDLRRRGVVRGTADLFRLLVDALPPWPQPHLTARSAPAVTAIERLVAWAPDPGQAARRAHELVAAGVAAFNRGALEKAGLVFSLVERLLDRQVVEAAPLEALRAGGHERLDLERLRRLLEGQDRREIPRALLRFFHVFDPEALLDKLGREPARQRRGLLLAFLEAHEGDGRTAAFERLGRPTTDPHDVFLLRNLVHLLRRIPGDDSPWMPERELARVVRLLVPENPPFLVREVLAYLAERRHPVAEQVLMSFVTTLEDEVLSMPPGTAKAERGHWWSHLDDATRALGRYGTPRTWDRLAEHGLRSEPELGPTGARLAALGREDLSSHPDLLARLVTAARDELPRGLLARPTAEQSRRLVALLGALAGTRTGDVQELLETLAERFSDEDVGRKAARVLAASAAGERGFPTADASLSGDLRTFALPTLLQNLGDSRLTGVLRLLDDRGRRAATLELERGRLVDARYGRLSGDEAVYQLLERPFRGTFAFVPGAPAVSGDDAQRPDSTQLLLEGLRRHDELRRASVIVPDDSRLEPTGLPPQAVPGEEDIDLVTALWERVVAGSTPRECEPLLTADAHRIRRCLVHWVEEGTLRLRPAEPGRR
jgi:hypothetical protein